MKLETLSPNLVTILRTIVSNQDQTIIKLINYDSDTPLNEADITNPEDLLFLTKIFPFPPTEMVTEVQSQLRVYYPLTDIKNSVIEGTRIFFDILTHESLYLFEDLNSDTQIRPYVIASKITDLFDNKSIGTVGVLHFDRCVPVGGGTGKFQVLRLTANMMTIGK